MPAPSPPSPLPSQICLHQGPAGTIAWCPGDPVLKLLALHDIRAIEKATLKRMPLVECTSDFKHIFYR